MAQHAPIDVAADEDFKAAMNVVLSYYSSQLQSHAATLVGFTIAILAAFSLKTDNPFAKVFLAVIVSLLLTVAGYTILRLVVYGGLSAAILYGNYRTVNQYANSPDPDFDWTGSLPQTKVSYYVHHVFDDRWRTKTHWRVLKGSWIYKLNDQPRPRILVLIWIASIVGTTLFLFLS